MFGFQNSKNANMRLPQQYQDGWFVISGLDKIFIDTALYNCETDEFYNSVDDIDESVHLQNMESGVDITVDRDEIENNLYDVWIPVGPRSENSAIHDNHYTIPAIDTGMRPVKEDEMYCTECNSYFMPD